MNSVNASLSLTPQQFTVWRTLLTAPVVGSVDGIPVRGIKIAPPSKGGINAIVADGLVRRGYARVVSLRGSRGASHRFLVLLDTRGAR